VLDNIGVCTWATFNVHYMQCCSPRGHGLSLEDLKKGLGLGLDKIVLVLTVLWSLRTWFRRLEDLKKGLGLDLEKKVLLTALITCINLSNRIHIYGMSDLTSLCFQ
jgi:hypothetical protein